MAQQVLRIEGLPQGALDAAAAFHAEWLPRVRGLLDPPRDGEVAARRADGGGSRPDAARAASPHHHPADGPPPRTGEDLVLIFPSAPYDHRAWRLAAIQDLARAAAPRRVNGIVGSDEGGIEQAIEWLAEAPGITGQLLAVR
jgi:hypothetical protein